MSLKPKQEQFCLEYLKDLNATQAAIRAGYSEKTSYSIGQENLNKPEIKSRIDQLLSERSAETKIDAAWLLNRLADEAIADVNDLYDENDRIKPVREWPKIWRQGLVAGMDIETSVSEDGEITRIAKLRISDRVKRLELIGKHIGVRAFEDQLKVTGSLEISDRLSRSKNRLGAASDETGTPETDDGE